MQVARDSNNFSPLAGLIARGSEMAVLSLPITSTMNTELPRIPPRRKRRWQLASIGAIAAIGAVALGIWRFSWWAPPTYTPQLTIAPVGERLSSAGHDLRTTMLGDAPYMLHIEPEHVGTGRGAILFFGALHSKDPNHAQQAVLRRAWDGFRPTVALVEGRMSFFVGTRTQGIRVFGEGAAVYSMAEQAHIPLYTLEPPLDVEIAALEECGDRTQVAMFRVLSGYISARRGGEVSDFKFNRLLRKRASSLTDALPDVAAFDAFFAAQFPDQPGWRELPEEAMWPGQTDTLLHRFATRSNQARDDHFIRAMLDLAHRGERVLAIAGRSHTLMLEPILWQSMQPAVRGDLSTDRTWETQSDQ